MNRSHSSSSSEREGKSMLTSDWHLTPQPTGNSGDCAGGTLLISAVVLRVRSSVQQHVSCFSVFFTWRADGVLRKSWEWSLSNESWNVLLKGGKAYQLDSLTVFFSFSLFSWDCRLSLLPGAGNWIYLCNIPRLQQILPPPLSALPNFFAHPGLFFTEEKVF